MLRNVAVTVRTISAHTNTQPSLTLTQRKQLLSTYSAVNPHVVYLRDGELVVYRRTRSLLYQCRYKLADGTWYRQSTRKASLEHAIVVACDIYDEGRYRQRLGLAHRAHTYAQIAALTLIELRKQIDASNGKTAYHTYVSCIEKYFVPYFAEHRLEDITHTDVVEFELWRDRQMLRKPKTSTLNNFTSAWNRVIATAVTQGFISERVPVPKLTTRGLKGKTRPAFKEQEINTLLVYMETWQHAGRFAVEHEIRPLVRDYVEMLLLTGMRHGTEAMGICWKDIEWHTHKDVKYLRVWVSGKTGGRWLIAKHRAVDVLKRLHARQNDIKDIPFDEVLKTRHTQLLFRFSTGYQPFDLRGTFRRLLRDCGLLKDAEGQTRTLYSLRHTYATLELLNNSTDIHTLSKQMGNSAAMIEKHYSKLTATMAADKLA